MKVLLYASLFFLGGLDAHADVPKLRTAPPLGRVIYPSDYKQKEIIIPIDSKKGSFSEKDMELYFEITNKDVEHAELLLSSPQWKRITACHLLDKNGKVIDIDDIVITSMLENGCCYYTDSKYFRQATAIRLRYLDEKVKVETYAFTDPIAREQQKLDFEIIAPILADSTHIQEAPYQYWVELHPYSSMHIIDAELISSSAPALLSLRRHDETRSLYGKLHMQDFSPKLKAEMKIHYSDQGLESVAFLLKADKGSLELRGFTLSYERMSNQLFALFIPREMVIKSVAIKDAQRNTLARHGQRQPNLNPKTGTIDESQIKEVYELYNDNAHSIEIQYFPAPYKNTTLTIDEPLRKEESL